MNAEYFFKEGCRQKMLPRAKARAELEENKLGPRDWLMAAIGLLMIIGLGVRLFGGSKTETIEAENFSVADSSNWTRYSDSVGGATKVWYLNKSRDISINCLPSLSMTFVSISSDANPSLTESATQFDSTVQVDDRPPFQVTWGVYPAAGIIVPPSDKLKLEFYINQILGGKNMKVVFLPGTVSQIQMSFRIEGIDAAYEDVKNSCAAL